MHGSMDLLLELLLDLLLELLLHTFHHVHNMLYGGALRPPIIMQ